MVAFGMKTAPNYAIFDVPTLSDYGARHDENSNEVNGLFGPAAKPIRIMTPQSRTT